MIMANGIIHGLLWQVAAAAQDSSSIPSSGVASPLVVKNPVPGPVGKLI